MTAALRRSGYGWHPTQADQEKIDQIIEARFAVTGNSMSTPDAIRYCLQHTLDSAPGGQDDAADDTSVLRVPLGGKYGKGKHVLVDAAVWSAGVAAGWPSRFVYTSEPTSKRRYVMAGAKSIPLARLVMGALPGEIVRFRNGDTTDCRRSNLEKLPGIAKKITNIMPTGVH